MKIKDIVIYPIKGLSGISMTECMAYEKGLEHDRRFMLVGPSGKFISQRENSQLALFETKIQDNKLTVTYGQNEITIPLLKEQTELKNVTVWEHEFQAFLSNPRIDHWFSEQLGKDCHLVYMDEGNFRQKALMKSPTSTEVSFADGYPYLILGTGSMDYLNEKMNLSYNIDRFRANIIIETKEEHVEDTMDYLSFGKTNFRMIKPCARCQVTTIDQKTGERSKEPLKTLATYRQKENKIYFGMNAVCITEGKIRVGDLLITDTPGQ